MSAPNDADYAAEIAAIQAQFAAIAVQSNVGVVVPAAMNIVLSAVTSITDKDRALLAVNSLRPMIDYIEAQVRGMQ